MEMRMDTSHLNIGWVVLGGGGRKTKAWCAHLPALDDLQTVLGFRQHRPENPPTNVQGQGLTGRRAKMSQHGAQTTY